MSSRSLRFAVLTATVLGLCGAGAVFGGFSTRAGADAPAPVSGRDAGRDFQPVPEPGDLAAPFGGRCSEECETTLSLLSDGDREALIDLPARAQRTLAEIGPLSADAATLQAADVAARLGDAEAGGEVAEPGAEGTLAAPIDLSPGERACTLRWFGFLDEAADTVGTHRCEIARAGDGTITVEKLTGERFLVRLAPLNDRIVAFEGRSFLPDQTERDYDVRSPVNAGNANFGNVFGLATLSGGQVFLVGGPELGMTEPDDTFFSVLTIAGS